MIRDKEMAFTLYNRSAFGNHLRIWPTGQDLINSEYRGPVSIRYLEAIGGSAPYFHHLPVVTALMLWESETKRGRKCYLLESAEDECITLQGEVIEGVTTSGIYLLYSRARTHMRAALREAQEAEGLRAKLLLQEFLTPSSYEDLIVVLDTWPGHVVEFTTFSKTVGWLRDRNMIVWEVRAY